MSKKTKGEQAKRPNPLPGRVYTLIVTGLAVLLVAIPLNRPQSKIWNTVAVVQHLPIPGNSSESIVIRSLPTVIEQVEVATIPEVTVPTPSELQANLNVATTEAAGGEEFLTTIQVRNSNRQLSADLAGQLAREFSHASQGDQTAAVISIESHDESRIARSSLLAMGAFALCFGAITTIFPRPRQTAKRSNSVEQVERATGIPVLGSVFPSGNTNTKGRSKNYPLRLTVSLAELIVAVAFMFMLYSAVTNANFVSQLIESPLPTYAESVRSIGTGIQGVSGR